MLVVKMRSKKREVGAWRGCAEDGRGWHKGVDGDEDEGVGRGCFSSRYRRASESRRGRDKSRASERGGSRKEDVVEKGEQLPGREKGELRDVEVGDRETRMRNIRLGRDDKGERFQSERVRETAPSKGGLGDARGKDPPTQESRPLFGFKQGKGCKTRRGLSGRGWGPGGRGRARTKRWHSKNGSKHGENPRNARLSQMFFFFMHYQFQNK
ncbi:hypothetical protein ALC60_05188 [Trachymyrmex zeteki]|uniref:Uncharacterized protein n=1 Tax=Mycetomoellerius zeteki TaxID=64791 RepID=A0A151X695_9HYME|nr:hypothetical protein ALC60_05188 [Trachymyrmex zeteki]